VRVIVVAVMGTLVSMGCQKDPPASDRATPRQGSEAVKVAAQDSLRTIDVEVDVLREPATQASNETSGQPMGDVKGTPEHSETAREAGPSRPKVSRPSPSPSHSTTPSDTRPSDKREESKLK
jgi:hypothetical protein